MTGSRLEEFHDAVKGGRLEEVERRVSEDPSLVDARQGPLSPVLLAIFSGREEVARLLVERGASVGPPEAAALGSVDLLESAFDPAGDDGADAAVLGRTDETGWSPLHLAAFLGHEEATRWLLERGADPTRMSENREANTPLHAALAGRGEPGVVRALLDGGADPGGKAALGVTPLHLAASRGDGAAVDALLEAGARPAPMEDGRLPSALAHERGHPELAERLEELERGGGSSEGRG